jgi:hypothetical protein
LQVAEDHRGVRRRIGGGVPNGSVGRVTAGAASRTARSGGRATRAARCTTGATHAACLTRAASVARCAGARTARSSGRIALARSVPGLVVTATSNGYGKTKNGQGADDPSGKHESEAITMSTRDASTLDLPCD